jgi:hypothetical protein
MLRAALEEAGDAALMIIGALEGIFAGEAEKRSGDNAVLEQIESRQITDAEKQRGDAEKEQWQEWRDAVVEVGCSKKIEERGGGIARPDGDGEADRQAGTEDAGSGGNPSRKRGRTIRTTRFFERANAQGDGAENDNRADDEDGQAGKYDQRHARP